MVRIDPASGPTITFFQFLFIALQGLSDFVIVKPPVDSEGNDIPLTSKWQKFRHLRMKELKIPILYHAGIFFCFINFQFPNNFNHLKIRMCDYVMVICNFFFSSLSI